MKSAYIIIAHGSREAAANSALFDFLGKFRGAYPERKVEGAFLELAKPSIPEALEKCIEEGAKELFIIPLMIFSGKHVKQDIPALIAGVKSKHPDVDFHYTGPLSEDPMMVRLLGEKVKTLKGHKS